MTSMPIDGVRALDPQPVAETRPSTPPVRHKVDELSPAQQFEAFTLRSFVESMLPSEESSYFGSGMAANIWRSQMAEQLGDTLARSGGIGIAATIAEDRGVATDAQAEIRSHSSGSARMRFDALLAETGKP